MALDSYDKVYERLNILSSRNNILYEPDYPSLSLIKKALNDYFLNNNTIEDCFTTMNEQDPKMYNKIGLTKKIIFNNYELLFDENETKITLYSTEDDNGNYITVVKHKNEDKCYLEKNTFERDYDHIYAQTFFSLNETNLLYMLEMAEKYKLYGRKTILYKVPYDIIKVSLILNTNNKDDKVDIIIEPNEKEVVDNKETRKAFNKVVPFNKDNIIEGLVYSKQMLSNEIGEIVEDYCSKNINSLKRVKK